MGRILVARESFVMNIDGTDLVVSKGQTRVDSEHPLAKRSPAGWWEEVDATYSVEQATAAPGERRAAPKAKPAKAEEAGDGEG